MQVEYEWKAGLVFGLEADKILVVPEEAEDFDVDAPPHEVIYLHLGFISIAFILGVQKLKRPLTGPLLWYQ